MYSLFPLAAIVGFYVSPTLGQTPSNPLKLANDPQLLGLRYPTNDQTVRDLGYQGVIGSTWINTFGDGVGCLNKTDRTSATSCACAPLTGRDGAGTQGDNMLEFTDVNIRTDVCNGVPQMARFCPELSGETDSSGFGITNIVPVDSTRGLLLNRPTFSTSLDSPGAGIAIVTVTNGNPVCSRPYGISSWGPDEPNWGQLSSLLDSDGYIYTYANGPNFGTTYNTTVLARVQQASAFDKSAYEYYHGNGQFNNNSIFMSQLNASSPELLVNAHQPQGHVVYSSFYKQYIMFGTFIGNLNAITADNPWGPWSDSFSIYNYEPGLIYSPSVQEKFTSADGKTFYISFTHNNTLPLIEVNWA